MSIPPESIESWLRQLLHPDQIPREALVGGMTSGTAWEHWAEDGAREAKGLPKVDRHLSSAERWWYQRFDHAHLQERGADSARPYPPPTQRPGQNMTWNRRRGDGRA